MNKYIKACSIGILLVTSSYAVASTDVVEDDKSMLSACQTSECKQFFKRFEVAVKRGHIEAVSTLGQLYYNGYGTEKNEDKALFYLKKAAKFKYNAAAQYKVGLIHLISETNYDVEESIKYLNRAASQNYKDANFLLGVLHFNEQHIPANYAVADKYLSKALKQKHSQVQMVVDNIAATGELSQGSFPSMWAQLNDNDASLMPDGTIIWPEDGIETITVMSLPVKDILYSQLVEYRSRPGSSAMSRIPTIKCADIIGCYSMNSKAGLDNFPGSYASVVSSGGNRASY